MGTVQRMQQISSLAQADRQVAAATAPRRFKYLNVPLLATVAVLVIYGLLVVYSAVAANENYNFSRQVGGVAIGIALMLLLFRFDYHQLSHYLVLFLIINIVLIMSPHIPLIGQSANGATSWVGIGKVRFQPGEFAKITVILQAASVVSRYHGKLTDPRDFLKALALMLVPFVCIMTQPDLGTGMVYLFIAGVALLVSGARPRYIAIVAGVLAGGIVALFLIDPIADAIAGHDVLLKNYQRARLLVFLDNSYDTSGDGYNLRQAKIAVGSGGILGKGWMNATQSTLGYLPEAPTDFIFCVLGEQFGFVGALALLALYGLLIAIIYQIAYNANDLFGTVLVMCAAGMWLFQILENIGMDIGLMPITGIPLPFMSYGSSFMVVNFVMLGFIGSVWAHSGR
ncbi:rod shape-determining protein RodA [Curtanaerobium respiraculi]|uniref:rod shape-determining protein RodA n=1 Tax=Curtanaerobium respiraculi TaxID=2949669 RepID=UPI003D179332